MAKFVYLAENLRTKTVISFTTGACLDLDIIVPDERGEDCRIIDIDFVDEYPISCAELKAEHDLFRLGVY